MRKTRLAFSGLFLWGCAATVPGPSQVQEGWDGQLGAGKVGLYILMPRAPYTVAQFECLSQADDALKSLDPGIRWTSVDSGSKGVRQLGGWDLDSLGDLLLADSAVWRLTGANRKPRVWEGTPSLSEATRTGLVRTCRAFGVAQLVVVKPGGSRNAKDSAKSFRDPVWFGVFDSSQGSQHYSLSVPLEGARSTSRSAEADWARQAWKTFVEGVLAIRSSRGK